MEKIRRNKVAIAIFILPAVILFAGFIIIPIFMSVGYSFETGNLLAQKEFAGIDNYKQMFENDTLKFTMSVKNAFLLAILSVFIQLPVSLGLALLISNLKKSQRFFITVFFIPVLMSTVVIGQLWSKIYNPNYGILNVALDALNIVDIKNGISWVANPKYALLAVFIPILWQYVGYHMLLMYAGIKSVSPDILEAATIDGANKFQTALKITIPMITPVIKVCVIFAVTGSLKAFDLIYVLAGDRKGLPSEVPSTLMVKIMSKEYNYGLGSAIAVAIIFLCFFFAILINKFFKTEVE